MNNKNQTMNETYLLWIKKNVKMKKEKKKEFGMLCHLFSIPSIKVIDKG